MSIALSNDIRRFLDEQIDSLEHLELFLLLARDLGTACSPEEAGQKVGLPADRAERRLNDLHARGLVERVEGAYRYVPTPQLGMLVAALMKAYHEQRLEVLHRVSERTLKRLRNFADAFRLRREGTGD